MKKSCAMHQQIKSVNLHNLWWHCVKQGNRMQRMQLGLLQKLCDPKYKINFWWKFQMLENKLQCRRKIHRFNLYLPLRNAVISHFFLSEATVLRQYRRIYILRVFWSPQQTHSRERSLTKNMSNLRWPIRR